MNIFSFHAQQIIFEFISNNQENYDQILVFRPKHIHVEEFNNSLLGNLTINNVANKINVVYLDKENDLYDEIKKIISQFNSHNISCYCYLWLCSDNASAFKYKKCKVRS